MGMLGSVIAGPTVGCGYTWYKINFDAGADGWVAEPYLAKVVTASLPESSTLSELMLRINDLIAQLNTLRAALVAGAAGAR